MATQDAGAALAALCASGVTGAVNVASGEPVTVGALAQEIAGLLGRPDLLRIGSRPDRPGEAPAMLADVTRLRREVGFDPAATRAEPAAPPNFVRLKRSAASARPSHRLIKIIDGACKANPQQISLITASLIDPSWLARMMYKADDLIAPGHRHDGSPDSVCTS